MVISLQRQGLAASETYQLLQVAKEPWIEAIDIVILVSSPARQYEIR
jgi:hypothetical protein